MMRQHCLPWLLTIIIGTISSVYSSNCNDVEFPTSGCQFFFNIPYIHRLTTPARLLVTTTTNASVLVNVTVPGMQFEANHTITRYQHAEIPIPPEIRLNPGDGIQNKTILVTSSDVVSVYAMDNEISKGEGFLVLPTSHLGSEYFIASFKPGSSVPAFICVSALEDETVVDIMRNRTSGFVRIVLQPFQSYRFEGSDGEDLTATSVRSDKPIAVVSGVTASIPVGVKNIDGLLEQLSPVKNWGREHTLSPFLGTFSGFVYRIISANENTTLSISNVGTVMLPASSFYEADVTDEIIVSVTSDKPVLVMQYMKGSYADPQNIKRGDPSMVVVPPKKSYANSVSFAIMDTTFGFDYHISVIIACEYINGLIYDDTTYIGDWNKVRSGDDPESMCSIRGRIRRGLGVHTVVHVDPLRKFSVFVYAISLTCCTSYSYVAGAGLPYVPYPSSPRPSPGTITMDESLIPVSTTKTTIIPATTTDNILVLSLIGAVCILVIIIVIMTFFMVTLFKRAKQAKESHDQHTTYSEPGPHLIANNNLTSDSEPRPTSSGSINNAYSNGGPEQVSLSGNGYVRYNTDAAENSYQGLYSSATLASSTNSAYESIPQ